MNPYTNQWQSASNHHVICVTLRCNSSQISVQFKSYCSTTQVKLQRMMTDITSRAPRNAETSPIYSSSALYPHTCHNLSSGRGESSEMSCLDTGCTNST